jgi:hypothetical protein
VGALLTRAAFIFAYIALLQQAAFVDLVFSAVLAIAGMASLVQLARSSSRKYATSV